MYIPQSASSEGLRRAAAGDDLTQLFRVDRRMLGGIVAEPSPPGRRPHHADRSENGERVAPAHRAEQEHDERLGERAAERAHHDGETEGTAALALRKPARIGAGG